MRSLVLGGAGFLGSSTTNTLLENKKNSVVVFDRDSSDFSRLSMVNGNLEIVTGDFCVYEDFEGLVKGCDVIFHYISTTIPSTSNRNMDKEIAGNVLPTIRLLDACVKQKVGKIVFLSSGGTVYGIQDNILPIKESNPTNPISSYGVQKLMIEKYIQVYNHVFGLDYRIIRLSNPFGPFQDPLGGQGVIATFAYRIVNDLPITIYGNGEIIRDFIVDEDAIKMILKITEKKNAGKLYNVGSGIGYSINKCLEVIEDIAGKKAILIRKKNRSFDVPVNVLDVSKYLSEISPIPARDIKLGIQSLIDYYTSLKKAEDRIQKDSH